jgi:hypothetical protein
LTIKQQQKKSIENYDLLFPQILEISSNTNQFHSARREIQTEEIMQYIILLLEMHYFDFFSNSAIPTKIAK